MMIEKFKSSEGYRRILQWMNEKGNTPFEFQSDTWFKYSNGYSGMVVAPTGFGKTFSVFLALVIDHINNPEKHTKAIQLLWITPLRSLAKDICKAMNTALEELNIDWKVGVRNGDTDIKTRQEQNRKMPEILIVTPETLHLLFSQKDYTRFFKNIHCVAVDEWHELLSTKRGVMTELAVSRLLHIQPKLQIWGITATIGNLDEALETLIPYSLKKTKIISKNKKKMEVISIFPDDVETLPWAGHLGGKLVNKVVDIVEKSKTTLVFTNTRSQAEMWYQMLLDAHPEFAGQIAIHHGSIDFELRNWIEDNLAAGYLKAVVTTSSLDLGVDFKPVDTVIQIGSSKGVARFMQRAGRSGHSPYETSKIYFLPTHLLELVEVAALKQALKDNVIEPREPMVMTFDILIQYLVTLAVSDGFREEEMWNEIKQTHAFSFMEEREWRWVLVHITRGGDTLGNYEEFHKVIIDEDGLYKVTSRKIALLHRLNMGAIVSDIMMQVKFMSGGYIGMIEEYFISKLKKEEKFVLAGRVLEIVSIKDMTVIVRAASGRAITPSWLGGRLPLTSNLSHYLRQKISEVMHTKPSDKELRFLHPLFVEQEKVSHIPHEDELLVELIKTREGYHLFMYPFEGRLVHEVMAAIIAYRISRIEPITFSIAMNDYGFELFSDQPIPVDDSNLYDILSNENLVEDIDSSMNASEMARRKFRDIAVISGMVIQRMPHTKRTNKSLQASAGLFYKVLEEHEPGNLLIRQAYSEVFNQQLEETRLRAAFDRIQNSKIVLVNAQKFTPLSFPIKVDSLRQSLTSEKLEDRIKRMQKANLR